MSKNSRFKSGFTLGGEQAEADPLLSDAFYESGDYDVIRSKEDPRCFVIGRTGAGKSAAFQRIEEEIPEHVIRINPEDLSLPYITDLQVIRYLDSLGVNLDLFWIALWKHVLLVEIIRHRYSVNTPAAKQSFLKNLRERISKDHGKEAALGYLDEFEGRFWCETEERVREITDKFTRRIDAEVEGGTTGGLVSARAVASAGTEASTESRAEQTERFQRIVNDTQLAKLNKMISVLDEDILDDQHFTYVIIDDLDRDWIDERLANDLIRCLFRTVLDLKRVRNLKVVVALRTNIFQELDFGKKSGGQEEKFRSLVLHLRWTRADLQELLDERVKASATRTDVAATSMGDLLPHTNKTRGNPLQYMLERTLMRPRDAIAFANECLGVGIGKTRLTWQDIHNAERTYSAKRLLALRDEWKPTYPGIDQVFTKFRGCSARMDKQEFQRRLDEAMLLISEPNFPGTDWLRDLSAAMWSPGKDSTGFALYQPLAKLLYSVGLIGCAVRSSRAPTFYLDDPLFVDSESNYEQCEYFFLHRMYQAALDAKAGNAETTN
ncbi:hypothetical protein [Paenarthrobacter sp. CAP02]|uniref:P-loop ATPase, Sll1717 family n=1 Tax=Paenarthrobacter sp. CAP02 TaxID=3158144 RepID=UPI0032DA44F8